MPRRGVDTLYGVELMIVEKVPEVRHRFGNPPPEFSVQYYGFGIQMFGQIPSVNLVSEYYLENPSSYEAVREKNTDEWYVRGAWGDKVGIYFSLEGSRNALHNWHTLVKEEAEEWATRLNTLYYPPASSEERETK